MPTPLSESAELLGRSNEVEGDVVAQSDGGFRDRDVMLGGKGHLGVDAALQFALRNLNRLLGEEIPVDSHCANQKEDSSEGPD